MLKAKNITKTYFDRSSGQHFDVLQECSLQVTTGEAVGLMGPSGCGKSTLARLLLRLQPVTGGQIFFDDVDITHLPPGRLLPFRRSVQFISQRPESFFDPLWKLGDSLTEPWHVFGIKPDREKLAAVLETVKLNPQLLERYPHQVSGGEIQRLSIARALLLQPRLLILDEPTSMLDISVQAQILQLLQSIRRQQQTAFLFISHDRAVINFMCDRTLVMNNGRLTPT